MDVFAEYETENCKDNTCEISHKDVEGFMNKPNNRGEFSTIEETREYLHGFYNEWTKVCEELTESLFKWYS